MISSSASKFFCLQCSSIRRVIKSHLSSLRLRWRGCRWQFPRLSYSCSFSSQIEALRAIHSTSFTIYVRCPIQCILHAFSHFFRLPATSSKTLVVSSASRRTLLLLRRARTLLRQQRPFYVFTTLLRKVCSSVIWLMKCLNAKTSLLRYAKKSSSSIVAI